MGETDGILYRQPPVDSKVKYREYYCEFQEDMVGEYEIKGDTLTLVEYNLSSQVPGSNSKIVPKIGTRWQIADRFRILCSPYVGIFCSIRSMSKVCSVLLPAGLRTCTSSKQSSHDECGK